MIRAYVSQQSATPGTTVTVHASGVGPARTEVRRWHHSDPSERGPGVQYDVCDWGVGTFVLAEQDTVQGSFAVGADVLPPGSAVTVTAWLHATSERPTATIVAWSGERGPCGLVVRDGVLGVKSPAGFAPSPIVVRSRQWTFVGLVLDVDPLDGQEQLTVVGSHWGRTGGPLLHRVGAVDAMPVTPRLRVASWTDEDGGDLDGHLAGLRVDRSALDAVDLMGVMNGSAPAAHVSWDLSDRRDPDRVPSSIGASADLHLVNAPAWSALVPPSPENAGAPIVGPGSIHFHTDDLADCRWPVTCELTVPDDAPPGLYTVAIDDGRFSEEVPFVVPGSSDVVLLVPTLTWQAYGNLGRPVTDWPGRSHYSLHDDGSPVVITTALRPCPTLSPHARLEVDGGDGFAADAAVVTHLMMADLYAWHWLESETSAPGVLDDRDLHGRGIDALEGVRVLVLSAHPEYWTADMLDALAEFQRRGGNVIYLGGNGLYWVTSLHAEAPHLMEVRRWGGSQTCSVEPGDTLHQFEDRHGGLWADSGRPPHRLVAVDFAGFGAGCLEFARTEAGHAAEWAWAFDGVLTDTLGAEGINQGAGNEFDSFGMDVDSAGRSVVLATARPASADHFATFEGRPGRAPAPRVRGDLVLTETPAGGLVLAVGSITASGCLVVTDGPAPLRRLCTNVLRRMLR